MTDDVAAVDEYDLVQKLLHVRDQVGGDDDGSAGVVVADDGVENVVPGSRVHAADGNI